MEWIFWCLLILAITAGGMLSVGFFLGWWFSRWNTQIYLDRKEKELAERTRAFWRLKQQWDQREKCSSVVSEDVDVSSERAKLIPASIQANSSEEP